MDSSLVKPKLVISACLSGERKRYDGKIIQNPFVLKLKEYCEFIIICPEVSVGLPVPRDRTILYKSPQGLRAIYLGNKQDITEKVLNFFKKFIKNLPEIDGFLLKAKSPSCGVSFKTKTYKDPEGKVLCGKYQGIMGREVLRTFPFLPVVDEVILRNKESVENFLIRIFALSAFRVFKESAKSIEELAEFHKKARYLIMSYSPSLLSEIEKVIALKDKELQNMLKTYEHHFKKALSQPFTRGKQINAILHLSGEISRCLSLKEKRHLFYLLNRYKNEEINLLSVLKYLKSLVKKYDKKELSNQLYLAPYPEELEKFFPLV